MPDYIQKHQSAAALPPESESPAIPQSPFEFGFALDRSESMSGIQKQAVQGFNALLGDQRRVNPQTRFSLLLFNDQLKELCRNAPLEQVRPLEPADYQPAGSTALLDAIGAMIQAIADVWDPATVKPRALIAILTDGGENDSKRFTLTRIFNAVHDRRQRCGWQFLFLCADSDSVSYGLKLGIQRANIIQFDAGPAGITALLKRVSQSVQAFQIGDPNFAKLLLGDRKSFQ